MSVRLSNWGSPDSEHSQGEEAWAESRRAVWFGIIVHDIDIAGHGHTLEVNSTNTWNAASISEVCQLRFIGEFPYGCPGDFAATADHVIKD